MSANIWLIYSDDGPPIVAYLAACSLSPQATYATLNLQTNSLILNSTQIDPQFWKLWSLEIGPGSPNITSMVRSSSPYVKLNFNKVFRLII